MTNLQQWMSYLIRIDTLIFIKIFSVIWGERQKERKYNVLIRAVGAKWDPFLNKRVEAIKKQTLTPDIFVTHFNQIICNMKSKKLSIIVIYGLYHST